MPVQSTVYWEDVEAGMSLPALEYDLTLTRLVAFLRATGLYDFVHFDREYARNVGARDAFISAPHVCGLFSRLLTDWAGPEAELRTMEFQLTAQSCVGDLLRVEGAVTRKYRTDAGEPLIELRGLNLGHALAASAATANVTLRLPTRSGGESRLQEPVPSTPLSCDPGAPEVLREMIGRERETKIGQGKPVSEDEIVLWCEALEDWNPAYWDREYAAASRRGGIIVPPAGRFLGIGSAANLGVGYLRPGATIPDAIRQGMRGHALLTALREGMIRANTPVSVPGYGQVAVVNAQHHYRSERRANEATRTFATLVGCSGRKTTRLGEGYFVTWIESIRNLAGEDKTSSRLTAFLYE